MNKVIETGKEHVLDIGAETDIYFQESWQKLFADRDNITWNKVRFHCEYGDVEYSFSERPVVIRGESYPYKDILTPYAFSGPVLKVRDQHQEESEEELASRRKLLAKAFDTWFQEYCEKEGIVAEFVQFNPWVGNDKDFRDFYDLSFRSRMIAMDLTVDNILMEEIHRGRRNIIRKAIKSGVTIQYDTTGALIPQLLECYKNTVDKYDAIDYYKFTDTFLQKLIDENPGQIIIAAAMCEDRCINASIMLKSDSYAHYFISGNTPEGIKLDGNSLMLYDFACKMKEAGCKLFVLGGAESQLSPFKNSFTKKDALEYYSGQKIRLPEVYDMLVEANGITETSYFPKYRDPGKRFYSTWVEEE